MVSAEESPCHEDRLWMPPNHLLTQYEILCFGFLTFSKITSSLSCAFRGVISMVIMKMTEMQTGVYQLFIENKATNYTVSFTVSIRSKCSLLPDIHNIPE